MDREWTDKRMDDFADRVDRFEANVDRRFDRFESDVKERFDKVDERFDKVGGKLDKTNRTLWAGILVLVLGKFLFG